MSRYTGPKCRLCRRAGEKLFLKGERCETQKCAMIRKNYAPGAHGNVKSNVRKASEFAKQLKEKQKLKRMFGSNERQFQWYYKKAIAKKSEITSLYLLKLLEKRLDNVLYRAGLAPSRYSARQIVNHGLIKLNGKKVTIPSIEVKKGDKFEVKQKSTKSLLFSKISSQKDISPKWLKMDLKNLSGEMIAEPEKDDLESNINIQTIIEYYSK